MTGGQEPAGGSGAASAFGSHDDVSLAAFRDSRVVVIDDQPANVALLSMMLRGAGLERVVGVDVPTQAPGLLREEQPDLVLLDLHMPELDGFQILDMVREQAAGEYVPVLVLTADITPGTLRTALSSGANDYVTKPFQVDEVLLRARNLLQTRALYRTVRRRSATLERRLEWLERDQRRSAADRERGERAVREVLGAGGPQIVFHAVVDAHSRLAVGFEALSRFPAGSDTPDVWFGLADRVGLGAQLEVAAARSAIHDAEPLPHERFLSLNLSPGALLSSACDDLLDDILDQTHGGEGHAGRQVVIELTEHVPVEDYVTIDRRLRPLRDEGIWLAVDDAGAGYAGFRHLLGLSPDLIKLDISLVRAVDVDPARRALASALVTFAANTGAHLVAEGVESAAELRVLEDLGIRWVQGFHLSRPVPAGSLLADLADHG